MRKKRITLVFEVDPLMCTVEVVDCSCKEEISRSDLGRMGCYLSGLSVASTPRMIEEVESVLKANRDRPCNPPSER